MPNNDNKVPSAEKILDLLEAFLTSNFKPMTVTQLMQKSGLKSGSTYRLLAVLEQRGYVVNDGNNRWMLGTKIVRFSDRYLDFFLNVIAQK